MVNESLMFIRQSHNFTLSLESNYDDMPVQNEVLNKMDAEELNELIMSLPVGYRTVFNLYVVEGYEHKEIAKILGISDNTSRTQLAKAKNKLRVIIEHREFINGKYGK
jgi:RNA polymerase sigma factor (sigma-70 family)